MFKITDEYGSTFPWRTPSYKLACAVAYFFREKDFEVMVVDCNTGRAMSEVSTPDRAIDAAAVTMVDVLLNGDYESRLEI